MRWLLVCLFGLPVAACATGTSAPADIPNHNLADIRLVGGGSLTITRPRDFGHAWCGYEACVRKVDIRTVRGRTKSRATEILIGGAMQNAWCGMEPNSAYCPSAHDSIREEAPLATDTQAARVWLDSLTIRDGRLVGGGLFNPCISGTQATKLSFDADEQAFEWIISHRDDVTPSCLTSAGVAMVKSGRRIEGARTFSFGAVRLAWMQADCRQPPTPAAQSSVMTSKSGRFTPGPLFDIDGQGDAEVLAIFSATVRSSYAYAFLEADLAACFRGALPEDERPDRNDFIQQIDPYHQK